MRALLLSFFICVNVATATASELPNQRRLKEQIRQGTEKMDFGRRAREEQSICADCVGTNEDQYRGRRWPRGGPPSALLKKTLDFLRSPQSSRVRRRDVVTIIDYSRPSSEKRMWVVQLPSLRYESHFVAHGKGSGTALWAQVFNGRAGKKTSVTGFLVTDTRACVRAGRTSKKEKGNPCLLLSGLEAANRNAYSREIMFHGADYVADTPPAKPRAQGRSWGCPAVARSVIQPLIKKTAGASLVYIHPQ